MGILIRTACHFIFLGIKHCKQYNQNANLSNCILCKDNMGFLFHVFYVKKCLKDAYNKPRKCEQMNATSLLYKIIGKVHTCSFVYHCYQPKSVVTDFSDICII